MSDFALSYTANIFVLMILLRLLFVASTILLLWGGENAEIFNAKSVCYVLYLVCLKRNFYTN
jgi:hypothetical protein